MGRTEQFEGNNLEEVLQAAAERVGCRKEELRFEILQERRGFLGVGTRSISLRIEVPETGGASPAPSVTPLPTGRRAAAPARQEPRPVAVPGGVSDVGSVRDQDGPEATLKAEEEDEGAAIDDEPTGPDATAPQVEGLVKELLAAMGLELEVSMAEEETRILVDMTGADRDLVLGDEGETIDALQYLVNRMAQRELGTVKRVQLESDGFRLEREEEIKEMALAAAEKVRRTGEPMRLSPLNPYERRIVHVTLSGSSGVETESEGGGFVKRVVVKPVGMRGNAGAIRREPGGRPGDRPRGAGRSRGRG